MKYISRFSSGAKDSLTFAKEIFSGIYFSPTALRRLAEESSGVDFVKDKATSYLSAIMGVAFGAINTLGIEALMVKDLAENLHIYSTYAVLGSIFSQGSSLIYELGRRSPSQKKDSRVLSDLECAIANDMSLTDEELSSIGRLQLEHNPSLRDLEFIFKLQIQDRNYSGE